MADVRGFISAHADVANGRGLEIGALHNPRLPEFGGVRYLDHATTEELRQKYAGNPNTEPHLDELVEVDYVWKPGRTLRAAIGDGEPFDFVVASHVIEHIANPVGWLKQIEEILVPGGVLFLVVPDMRFCFDARRQPTSTGQIIDAYLRDIDIPSYQSIYDHESNFLGDVSTTSLWEGLDVSNLRRIDTPDPDVFAYERCLAQRQTGAYVDVHCHTFTPASFVELADTLVRLGLLDLRLDGFRATEYGDLEFLVALRRSTEGTEGSAAAATQRAVAAAQAAVARDRVMGVSGHERRMILAKRASVHRVRAVSARVRRLLRR